MEAWARAGVAVPVALGLAAASMSAVDAFRADRAVRIASTEIATWVASRTTPADSVWEGVREELASANDIVANDPGTLELLGILHSMRHTGAEYGQAAVVYFRQALAVRPSSPYTWANLAEVSYMQGRPASEIESVLSVAAFLGPSEPEIQRIVTDYGLALWDESTPAFQQTVERMLDAGLRRNPLEMLQISERRGRLAFACRHLVGNTRAPDPKWYQLCQSTEATP